MKYIKLFEKIERNNYVIIKTDYDKFSDRLNKFLVSHIGIIEFFDGTFLYVHFLFKEQDSEEIKNEFGHTQGFHHEDILYYSKDRKELQLKLDAGKYNL